MRPPSPAARCALTAPFHPCLCPRRGHRRFAFCGTFRRRPKPTPGRYPAPCSSELGLSSIGAPKDPTATLTSHILVLLVYLYGRSITTALDRIKTSKTPRRSFRYRSASPPGGDLRRTCIQPADRCDPLPKAGCRAQANGPPKQARIGTSDESRLRHRGTEVSQGSSPRSRGKASSP